MFQHDVYEAALTPKGETTMKKKVLAAKVAVVAPVIFFALTLILGGCVTLPTLLPPSKPVENVPFSQISQMCKEDESNPIRARERFAEKVMTVTVKGKIFHIDSDHISITPENKITAGIYPKDKQVIRQVSNGQTISASGVLTSVGTRADWTSCVIIIQDATLE